MHLQGEATKHDRGLEAHLLTTLTSWEEGTRGPMWGRGLRHYNIIIRRIKFDISEQC